MLPVEASCGGGTPTSISTETITTEPHPMVRLYSELAPDLPDAPVELSHGFLTPVRCLSTACVLLVVATSFVHLVSESFIPASDIIVIASQIR